MSVTPVQSVCSICVVEISTFFLKNTRLNLKSVIINSVRLYSLESSVNIRLCFAAVFGNNTNRWHIMSIAGGDVVFKGSVETRSDFGVL